MPIWHVVMMNDFRNDPRSAGWLNILLRPLLFLLAGVVLIVLLGLAQRVGWISAGGGTSTSATAGDSSGSYICPMMCTPPLSEPGRCPVCAMELVPATSGTGQGGMTSIEIPPAARRVANIQTAPVESKRMLRTIRSIGELRYDEGSLKTISAYVDGRLEKLYADYTGAVVAQGDPLALVYSPRLYSAQVEYLLATQREQQTDSTSRRFSGSLDMVETSRQKLIELGMTPRQIESLAEAAQADSRLTLHAPSGGTITEKLAVEGQYIKEGEPIYRLADLSRFWLMLRLFPEDAASIRYGQQVEAEMQSLPGRIFTGRVAFVDPSVDPTSRTVGVRVVIPNPEGLLRSGDYATAKIKVPLDQGSLPESKIYDPELADKWVSPRHPHVIESQPGACRECGAELVAASSLGFTADPQAQGEVLTVPRDAVLMAGNHSVLYVEAEPGRFEIRQVVLGPSIEGEMVIHRGVKAGEMVATRGNFLIDSQMQLAGNPSLIDPTKHQAKPDPDQQKKIEKALAALSAEDLHLAHQQQICPVTRMPLGAMGTPLKINVEGRDVLICCKACVGRLQGDPEKYLADLPPPTAEAEEAR
ncbi:MAG: efflux RND transporter periplasmic adaptor subunit [Pirellulaceae bacterium]